MIRRANIDDIDAAVGFAVEFHGESVHAHIPVDLPALRTAMAGIITVGAVFLSDHGIIGGLIDPTYFNPGYRRAVELFWWAPQEGRALREAFEAWAAEQGAFEIVCSGQRNERADTIEKLFGRAGYAPVETVFVKRI